MTKRPFDLILHSKDLKTVHAYPKVADGQARLDVESCVRDLFSKYIATETLLRAYVVYRGLAHVHGEITSGTNRESLLKLFRASAQALGVQKKGQSNSISMNSDRFEHHNLAVQRCCSKFLPDVKSTHKQCAVVIHIGATAPGKDWLPPTNDAWLNNYEFEISSRGL